MVEERLEVVVVEIPLYFLCAFHNSGEVGSVIRDHAALLRESELGLLEYGLPVFRWYYTGIRKMPS